MFPGSGRYTYSGGQQQQQQQPPQGYYAPPQGPPPGQYNNYGPPSGPPPGQYGNYRPPSGPPPGQQQQNYGSRAQPGMNGEPDYGHQYGSGSYSQPPTNQQSFGVENYNYQYSMCNGRKKALLVGINYLGSQNQLNGCINDVNNVERFLVSHGFSEDNIVKLTDDQRTQRAIPTRQNILDAIQWLVKDARPNDSLFSLFGSWWTN